jgi:hypothetical protein
MAATRRTKVIELLGNDTQELENFRTAADPGTTAQFVASVAIPPHRVRDADFSDAILARIGAINPSHDGAKVCTLCAGAIAEKSFAHHAHACTANKGLRTTRHTRVSGVIQHVVVSLPGRLFTVQHEPPVADHYPRRADAPPVEADTQHRGDFIVLHNNSPNVRFMCDLVITYPNKKTAGLGEGKGVQCARMEAVKLDHYNKSYVIPQKELVPFACQPNGFIGRAATVALRQWCWSAATAQAKAAAGPLPKDKPLAQHQADIRSSTRTKYMNYLSSARARIGATIVSATAPQHQRFLRSARAPGPSSPEHGHGE